MHGLPAAAGWPARTSRGDHNLVHDRRAALRVREHLLLELGVVREHVHRERVLALADERERFVDIFHGYDGQDGAEDLSVRVGSDESRGKTR